MAAGPYKYRAFISYAHADEKWARWLHRSLETYRVPRHLVGQKTEFGPVPAKLAPIFRDRDELASATDLGEKLTAALEGAATLIVICSRASAASHWVNEEILAYKRLGRANRIFSLIVDGEPYSAGIPGEEDQECFPQALRYQLGSDGELGQDRAEPIAADARPGKDGRANAKIKLVAGMLGLGFDDLKQRELHRRNRRLAIITASAVVGMIVAIGLATMAVVARNEAERQRERAEREAETARQTASFMIDLFAVSDPGEARGKTITAREILTKGAERIRTDLRDQPAIQTSLMDTIGKVYTNLGLYSDASAMLRDAVDLRESLTGIPREEYARSLYNLANALVEQADYEAAAPLYDRAQRELESAGQGQSSLHIDVLAARAELYFRTGEFALAEPLLRQVLAERLALFGPDDPAVADAIEELGLNFFDQGKLDEAEERLREALALRWKILGEEPHPDIAENLNNLALVLSVSGELVESEALYEQTLEMNRALYSGAHPLTAMAMSNLARGYGLLHKYEAAEALYLDALAMQRELLGEEHPAVGLLITNLASNYADKGDIGKAIETANEALRVQTATLGENHPNTAIVLRLLGRLYNHPGTRDRAEQYLRSALAVQLEAQGAEHPATAYTQMELADVLLATGAVDEAAALAQRSDQTLTAALSERHELTMRARGVHGAALLATGDLEGAEQLLRSSYELFEADPNARPAAMRRARARLYELYSTWGKPELAARFAGQPGTGSGSG